MSKSSITAQTDEASVVHARQPDDPRVLSFGQERLWYLNQLAPDSPVYNLPFHSRLHGNLHIQALRLALDEVIGRHEVLRTVIVAPGGRPRPLLLKKWAVEFKQIDLLHLSIPEREKEADRLLREEGARPFDFARDLMLRVAVIRMGDEDYIFLHNTPHAVFDGGSFAPFYNDLGTLYDAFLARRPPLLPHLRVQYADYALWQRRFLTGERLDALMRFWKAQLTGAPNVKLPVDFPRPGIQSGRGKRHFFSMPPNLSSAATRFFRESGTTAYRGLLATFNVFLHCYTGQTDISVGSPFGGRRVGTEDVIGFFVNTVVLRTDLSGNPTFREVMSRVARVVREGLDHSDLTFNKLVEAVQPPRDPSRTPLFQVNFRAPKQPFPCLSLKGLAADYPKYVDNGTTKFDLSLEIESSAGEACYFEYSSDLFREQTIVQLVNDFKRLLSALIEKPETPLNELVALTDIRTGAQSAGYRFR
jgi:condensation domain-containing protein